MQPNTALILNKRNFSSFIPRKEIPIDIYWFRATADDNTSFQSVRMHHHTFFELHFCIEGELTYTTPTGEWQVPKGSGLLISPHMRHMVRCSPDFFKISLAFAVEEDTPLYAPLVEKSNTVFEISDEVRKTVEFILDEAQKNSEYSETLTYARLLELVCRMADLPRRRPERRAEGEERDERLFKAKCYIDDNGDAFLTCADVASYCHISEKQLKRLFLKYEGCSLLAYIHQRKREDAERLVSESDLSFADIGEMLGFSSVAYFHRFFTEHVGMTPGDYRRTHRG